MESDPLPRIAEGFPGQRSVVLPRPVVAAWLRSAPLLELLPSDVGHYPHARWHYRQRPEGSPQLIFAWCLQGEGWLSLGDEMFRIRPGQAMIIPPGAAHTYGADQRLPWTIYWVHMAGTKVGNAQRLLVPQPGQPVLSLGQDPALAGLFEEMLSLLERGYTPANLLWASLCLGQVVARVAMGIGRPNSMIETTEERIENAVSFMLRRLDRKIRVNELAALCKVSPSHFAALFKKRTGFTAIDFFLRLKMQRACQLLDSSDLPVKAISAVIGFDDPLYFSRCFHRVHACSPSQYRALRKG